MAGLRGFTLCGESGCKEALPVVEVVLGLRRPYVSRSTYGVQIRNLVNLLHVAVWSGILWWRDLVSLVS
jgi:hypothetical protein